MRGISFKGLRGEKKISLYLLVPILAIIAFSLCFVSESEAKDKKKKALTPEQKKELARKAKEDLDGTSWKITLRDMVRVEGKKVKQMEDEIYFKDMRVRSKRMTDEGFNPTNYTVRVKGRDNETTVWETMQTSEDKGVAFWRGSKKKGSETMRGVLSWHISDTKKEDYSFRGIPKIDEPEDLAVEELALDDEAAVIKEAAPAEPKVAVVKQKVVEKKAVVKEPVKEESKKKWWQK